jgi:hypothetical protein
VVVNSESLRNRSKELGISSEKKLTLFGEAAVMESIHGVFHPVHPRAANVSGFLRVRARLDLSAD